MSSSDFRPINWLALLLGAVLALSFGLNVLLLNTHVEAWPDADEGELSATTTELRLTRHLLTQCQGRQQQQDSLLAGRPVLPPTPASAADPSPAFYSTK